MTLPPDVVQSDVRAALRAWRQLHVLERLDAHNHAPLKQQLLHFQNWYPGGLDSYLRTATRLYREQQGLPPVAASASQAPSESDAFASWVPTVPRDNYGLLSLDAPKLRGLEALGLQHAAHSAYVVVAGGLGERLGYQGIKLALPVETVTRKSYLELYIQHLLALERQTPGGRTAIPLAIMTSDATHAATHEYLLRHDNFGMPAAQITLLKQDTVPCLDAVVDERDGDLALRLVLDAATSTLVMKPHGHGDVHTLLHTSSLARKWLECQNKTHVHFIQDTNALILNSTLPLLGASVANRLQWTFTVVPRKAKDASGAIVQFTDPRNTHNKALFNVEYHELDHFLRSQPGDAFRDGDTNDATTGFSPFPGNINHFVAELASYVRVLDASRGKTPEIFNPKYRTDQKELFKSPARLECMMQDFPKLLVSQTDPSSSANQTSIGFLSFPSPVVYSPCKNDTVSAASKAAADVPPQCACSAEHELFSLNKAKLEQVGIRFTASGDSAGVTGSQSEWLGIPVAPHAKGPHVVFSPSFGIEGESLSRRFPVPSEISITARSTLVVEGGGADGVTFTSLRLDGALRISACCGAFVSVNGLEVTNAGFAYETVTTTTITDPDPVDTTRGYILKAREVLELSFDSPGRYNVEKDGSIAQLH